MVSRVSKIVSGGQTGADRAALDVAIRLGIPHGGWCPRGRLAEDGRIPDRYWLTETPSDDVDVRTEWNVRDSDATVVFSVSEDLGRGSELTIRLARDLGKPVLWITGAMEHVDARERLMSLLRRNVRILNVGGSRASEEAGVGGLVARVLFAALSGDSPGRDTGST